jgi:hypothetical protein
VPNPSAPVSLVPFDFHGDQLLLADRDGKPHIVLKPAIESLGLDYPTQYAKLRRRSWAVVGQSPTTGSDGKTYQMVTVDVRTFLMLLATIDETRVSADVKPKLVMYQSEVADAIEAYWTKGGALNPRATADQLEVITKQAAVLTALRGVVDGGWLDAKGRVLAARALGETPDLDPATKPLTVAIYLAEHGVTGAAAKSLASQFGKRLKAAYVAEYGEQPPQIEDVVGRHTTKVNQYQEQHRPLFDHVWNLLCGRVPA